MARHHSTCCDCERCHPSKEALKFLVKPKTKKQLSPETLYTRRKQQERRVAEELQQWSTQDFSTPKRVTRSGSSTPMTVSSETLTVVRNILRRFKESQGVFFTHLEIQIMFFWHTYQAIAGELMDPALPMMITGVLIPYATDMELHTQATSELNEMARLLAGNGAEMRIWEALAHRTMFYFKTSNIAIAHVPPFSESTSTSPSREAFNEISNQTAQSSVAGEEASPAPKEMMVMEISPTETRLEQLEEDNCLLIEKVYYLEDERAQFQEEWQTMERKFNESEAENQRLRSLLEASLQIFAEPWDTLKDKHANG
jgi:hypothetical protein